MTLNEVTYTTLNNGHCKGGKVVIYLALVEHMKENGCEPSIHNYKTLMNGFHKENYYLQIRRLRVYTMKSTMYTMQLNSLVPVVLA